MYRLKSLHSISPDLFIDQVLTCNWSEHQNLLSHWILSVIWSLFLYQCPYPKWKFYADVTLLFFLFNLLACFAHTFLCLILKERTSSWYSARVQVRFLARQLKSRCLLDKKKNQTESRNSSVTNSLKTLKMVPIKIFKNINSKRKICIYFTFISYHIPENY